MLVLPDAQPAAASARDQARTMRRLAARMALDPTIPLPAIPSPSPESGPHELSPSPR